jgi:protein-tyrosine phosphatase
MHRSVLFVCLGNICRSPAAEGVLQQKLRELGHTDTIFVDSAGTAGYHSGEPADTRMRQAAARRGYQLESLARQLEPKDLTRFDLIVAMDRENFSNIQQFSTGPAPHVRMLSDFLDDGWLRDVPDPYYGGDAGFEEVLDMIEAAAPRIIAELVEKREG